MTQLGLAGIAGIATLSTGVAILLWFAFGGANVGRKRTLANLKRQLDQPKNRIALPERKNVSDLDEVIRRQTPAAMMKMITKLWAGAGRPEAWPVERIIATKYL